MAQAKEGVKVDKKAVKKTKKKGKTVEEMTEYWQDSKKTLAERGAHLLETGVFSDVEFLLYSGENVKKIPAHKLILSMGSPVFEAMFRFPFEEKEPIPVTDIAPNIFSKMLQYLYTDDVSIGENMDEVLQLYYAADKYLIPKLKNDCNIYFQSAQLYQENICNTLERATLLNIECLQNRCVTFISQYTTDVLKSSGFLNLKKETVQMVLEMEEVSLNSEIEFFSALLAWGRAECTRKSLEENSKNMKDIVGSLIPCVRFLAMSLEEFIKAVDSAEGLFDKAEVFTVCQKISIRNPNQVKSLPKWCSSRSRRFHPEIAFNIEIPSSLYKQTHVNCFPDSNVTSSVVSLVSLNNNFVLKGVTLHWMEDNKQLDGNIFNKPTNHSYTLEASNSTTGITVNVESSLITGQDIKLIFSNFIPVARGEEVLICVAINKYSPTPRNWKRTENQIFENFSIILRNQFSNTCFVIKELIYFLKA